MIGADAALAALINQAAVQYTYTVPAYMTFTESTHIEGANRAEDINRSESVRVADDFAVMHDLPNGATRTGPAFPVIPLIDPFSPIDFSYFANLKRIDITFIPRPAYYFKPPAPNPNVNAVVPYFPYWYPQYAPDSTPDAIHLLIDRTSVWPADAFYVSDVKEDAATHLPSHATLQTANSDMVIGLDFTVIDGYWVVTRGTFSATQHTFLGSFKVTAETDYTNFAFSTTAPDPAISGTPGPTPTPLPTPTPTPS